MTWRNAWPSVIIAAVGAAVAGTMAISRVPQDTIVLIMSILVVPVISALIGGQLGETKSSVNAIQQQTNGNMGRLLGILESQSNMLAQMTPLPTATATAPAPATIPPGATK